MDLLEYDIKKTLSLNMEMKMQWKDLFRVIHQKYERQSNHPLSKSIAPNNLRVYLHRKLVKLIKSGDLKKDNQGHQRVFYFVPKSRHKKIQNEIFREEVHQKLDENWNKLSFEQRKKTMEQLVQNQGKIELIINNLTLEMADFGTYFAKEAINKIKKDSELKKSKTSAEDQKKLVEEIENLEETSNKLKKKNLW